MGNAVGPVLRSVILVSNFPTVRSNYMDKWSWYLYNQEAQEQNHLTSISLYICEELDAVVCENHAKSSEWCPIM